ncbi:MAG: transcriptional regulator with XRE-family HTH domain, partial [Yoonia sp.]
MATQRLAGSRIREKRLDQGLRQAAVAETVGISPSYLNLIEHNRRRIGGKLLSDIARALGVEPALLVDGADADMLDQMRGATSRFGSDLAVKVEITRAEEMAARYPGWGALIVAQSARITALGQQVQALSDRMSHDPQLAGALHEVISAVSAIRSASSILVGPEKLDADWQRRFHENIHSDSLRLATSSEAMIAYLEAPDTQIDQTAPIDQVERHLTQTDFHIAALEDADADPKAFAAQSGLKDGAQSLLESVASRYVRDAISLP